MKNQEETLSLEESTLKLCKKLMAIINNKEDVEKRETFRREIMSAPYEVKSFLFQQIYVKELSGFINNRSVFLTHPELVNLTFTNGKSVWESVSKIKKEFLDGNKVAKYVFDSKFKSLVMESLHHKNEDEKLREQLIKDVAWIDIGVYKNIVAKMKNTENDFKYATILLDISYILNAEKRFFSEGFIFFASDKEKVKGKKEIFLREGSEELKYYKETLIEFCTKKGRKDIYEEFMNDYDMHFNENRGESITAGDKKMPNGLNYCLRKTLEDDLYSDMWEMCNEALVDLYYYYEKNKPHKINEAIEYIRSTIDLYRYKERWLDVINEEKLIHNLLRKKVKFSEDKKEITYVIKEDAWFNLYSLFEEGVYLKKTEKMNYLNNVLHNNYLEAKEIRSSHLNNGSMKIHPSQDDIQREKDGKVMSNHIQNVSNVHKVYWSREIRKIFNIVLDEWIKGGSDILSANVTERSSSIAIKIVGKANGVLKEDFIENMLEQTLLSKRNITYGEYSLSKDLKTQSSIDDYLNYVALEKAGALKSEGLHKVSVMKRKF